MPGNDQSLIMEEISIKVTIGNRVYPLKIKKDDQERVLKSAQLVNDRIKEYEKQFGGSDKYDHIAMCAMQFATELVNLNEDLPVERENVRKAITDIDSRISQFLK